MDETFSRPGLVVPLPWLDPDGELLDSQAPLDDPPGLFTASDSTEHHVARDNHMGTIHPLLHSSQPLRGANDTVHSPHVFLPLFYEPHSEVPDTLERTEETGRPLSSFHRFSPVYPLVTRRTFARDQSTRQESPVFQSFLIALKLWEECFAFKSGSTPSSKNLRQATRDLVQHRGTYDFSIVPEAYTVCASIVLFVAHNLLEQHNRAFLYLSEAIALVSFQSSSSSGNVHLARRCSELALYNTEMASLPLYMDPASQRRTRTAPEIPKTVEDLLEETGGYPDDVVLDPAEKDAISIVIRLSQIYRASETISVDELGDIIRQDQDEFRGEHGGSMDSLQTQLVDSKITALWQLSNLFASHDTFVQITSRGRTTENILELFREHSTLALRWINTVQPGALRIIGLAKLTAITKNLVTLQQCASILGINHLAYNSVFSGLAQCIVQGDYEHKYSSIFDGLNMGSPLDWRIQDVLALPYGHETSRLVEKELDNNGTGGSDGPDSAWPLD